MSCARFLAKTKIPRLLSRRSPASLLRHVINRPAMLSRGRQEPEPAGRLHGVPVQIHPLQLGEAAGHPVLRQRPVQRLQHRLQVRRIGGGGASSSTLPPPTGATDDHFLPSSIEFDRDCDYFAIAGVTKKIKVFEYGTVIQDAVDIHYPVNEMTCNSKIRSVFRKME